MKRRRRRHLRNRRLGRPLGRAVPVDEVLQIAMLYVTSTRGRPSNTFMSTGKPAPEVGISFVPWIGTGLADLCPRRPRRRQRQYGAVSGVESS
jgi:hypothetical protein